MDDSIESGHREIFGLLEGALCQIFGFGGIGLAGPESGVLASEDG